jgi:RNA polymerase sigma-70 factor (ECF subfamily)
MAGDVETHNFIRLLTSHQLRLRAFALSLVPNWADADEVTQQASLVMWQKFDQFQPGTSFFSWAAKIVHLTAKDFRKRKGREAARFGDQFMQVMARKAVESADDLADREQALSECLRGLKPKQRELLDLKYAERRSADRIAEQAGMSADAVAKALTRVRRALYDCVNRTLRREGLA